MPNAVGDDIASDDAGTRRPQLGGFIRSAAEKSAQATLSEDAAIPANVEMDSAADAGANMIDAARNAATLVQHATEAHGNVRKKTAKRDETKVRGKKRNDSSDLATPRVAASKQGIDLARTVLAATRVSMTPPGHATWDVPPAPEPLAFETFVEIEQAYAAWVQQGADVRAKLEEVFQLSLVAWSETRSYWQQRMIDDRTYAERYAALVKAV